MSFWSLKKTKKKKRRTYENFPRGKMKLCRHEELWKNEKLGKNIEGEKDGTRRQEVKLQELKLKVTERHVEHLTVIELVTFYRKHYCFKI